MVSCVPLLRGTFLVITVSYAFGLRYRQLRSTSIKGFDDKLISEFPLVIINGTAVDCQMRCLWDDECMSFFHNRFTGLCQIHGVVFFNLDDGQLSPGSRYYKQVQESCPSELGYIYNRALNFCYKIHYLNPSSPTEARQVCEDEGGTLVILDTMEKIGHIGWTIGASTFPATEFPGFLIGATAEGYAAGDWHWPDGREVDQIIWNWCPGRPSPTSIRVDIAMEPKDGYPPACMKDARTGVKPFVCERQM